MSPPSIIIQLLTCYSGSLATVIRIFYIHELKGAKEFLYHNADISIWSTVEPGMGITATSLACMKPLFRKCFSQSRYLASNTTAQAWNTPPRRPVCNNNNNGLEELHLHENLSKSIRVDTIIATHSARHSSDTEVGTGLRPESEIANMRPKVGSWNESLTGDISDWRLPSSEGSKVVSKAEAS
jgi:hypothetical protein